MLRDVLPEGDRRPVQDLVIKGCFTKAKGQGTNRLTQRGYEYTGGRFLAIKGGIVLTPARCMTCDAVFFGQGCPWCDE